MVTPSKLVDNSTSQAALYCTLHGKNSAVVCMGPPAAYQPSGRVQRPCPTCGSIMMMGVDLMRRAMLAKCSVLRLSSAANFRGHRHASISTRPPPLQQHGTWRQQSLRVTVAVQCGKREVCIISDQPISHAMVVASDELKFTGSRQVVIMTGVTPQERCSD